MSKKYLCIIASVLAIFTGCSSNITGSLEQSSSEEIKTTTTSSEDAAEMLTVDGLWDVVNNETSEPNSILEMCLFAPNGNQYTLIKKIGLKFTFDEKEIRANDGFWGDIKASTIFDKKHSGVYICENIDGDEVYAFYNGKTKELWEFSLSYRPYSVISSTQLVNVVEVTYEDGHKENENIVCNYDIVGNILKLTSDESNGGINKLMRKNNDYDDYIAALLELWKENSTTSE